MILDLLTIYKIICIIAAIIAAVICIRWETRIKFRIDPLRKRCRFRFENENLKGVIQMPSDNNSFIFASDNGDFFKVTLDEVKPIYWEL